jgi:hypothetical protein
MWAVLLAVLFGALAAFLLFIGGNLTTVMSDMCSGSIKSSLTQITDLARQVKSFDEQARGWTSQYMCSQLCPCDQSVKPARWDEARLNK